MALDAYLQIDGIKGESTDSSHKDWIEVLQRRVEHPPAKGNVSIDSGWTDERAGPNCPTSPSASWPTCPPPSCSSIVRWVRPSPKAKFEFMRADGDGKPICYYTVELENVMISGVNPNERRRRDHHRAAFLRVLQNEVAVHQTRRKGRVGR